MPSIDDANDPRAAAPSRSGRTRTLRLVLPWALMALLGLAVGAAALNTQGRALFVSGRPRATPIDRVAQPPSPEKVVASPNEQVEKPGGTPEEAANLESSATAKAEPIEPVSLPEADPATPIASPSPDVEGWLDSVVSLETGPAERRERLGAGLLVSEAGDVLTCLHVVRGVRSITVVLRDGAAYEAIGFSALDAPRDLAVLRLTEPPFGATVFPIDRLGDAARLAPVVALGHPEGAGFAAFGGTVSNLITTGDLPIRSRDFLDETLKAADDVSWIQHTAKLLPGCSGGPLLSRSGELLGVDAWTDDGAGLGYAIAGRHVEAILAAVDGEAIEPIAEVAARHVDWADLERDLSADNVDRTLARAKAFDWRPESEDDYRALRELAALVTFANQTSHALRTQSGLEEDAVQSLRTATDRAETSLRGMRWDPLVQMTLVNEAAERTLDEPQGGCFLFVTTLETFDGPRGERGMLAALSGGERRVFLRIDSLLERPEPGTHWLALGIRQNDESISFGANPLDPEIVPQIHAGALIPFELR